MAPAYSKFSRPDFGSSDDQEISFNALAPQESWPVPPRFKNRPVPIPVPTRRDPATSAFSGAPSSGQNSRRPHLAIHPTFLDQEPRYPHASDDRCSPSHISISDDSDESGTELTKLRKENVQLKTECENLKGQVTGLTYVHYLI